MLKMLMTELDELKAYDLYIRFSTPYLEPDAARYIDSFHIYAALLRTQKKNMICELNVYMVVTIITYAP